jgi:hypothetical protein
MTPPKSSARVFLTVMVRPGAGEYARLLGTQSSRPSIPSAGTRDQFRLGATSRSTLHRVDAMTLLPWRQPYGGMLQE